MRMRSLRVNEPAYDVILGPCPGCLLWQVDYTDRVALTYLDAGSFHDLIEVTLREHLDECLHLQQFLADPYTS